MERSASRRRLPGLPPVTPIHDCSKDEGSANNGAHQDSQVRRGSWSFYLSDQKDTITKRPLLVTEQA